jgi:tetratricopeptide (TPR) repeat protein
MLKSIELDPLSPVHYVAASQALGTLKQYDEATRQLNKALEIDPRFPRAHAAIGLGFYLKGQQREAVEATQKSILYSDSSVEYLAQLGFIEGRIGKKDEARRILDDLLSRRRGGYVPPFLVGELYIGLGEADSAFVWLNRAADEHSNNMEYLIIDPTFDPIRNDPRFATLMRKVGLPQ